ncbi:hypothetical protein TNCV_4464641 [Trichonephila clavipes]|nr:hypothetical protein TNCV_4464641 [Trichonephila clavipes]
MLQNTIESRKLDNDNSAIRINLPHTCKLKKPWKEFLDMKKSIKMTSNIGSTEKCITSDIEFIAAVCVSQLIQENDEHLHVENTVKTHKISHTEKLKIIKIALRYFKHQGASVMDLLFLHCLRDGTAECRVQYRKQQDIAHFITK